MITELNHRIAHMEVVKEIKTRQKQIFWKQQTCMIIKQGGLKVKVNKEIRRITRLRNTKKKINSIIKQGGLKSRVLTEIHHLRMIADMKKQRDHKAKVVSSIRQMAKAKES